jgi:amidase
LTRRKDVAGVVAERARAAQPHQQLEEMTIAQMQAELTSGRLTAHSLTKQYLDRIDAIDRRGPGVERADADGALGRP